MPLVKHPSRTPKISCNCLLISTHGRVHDRAFDLINDFVTVKSKRLGLLFVTSFKPFIPAFNSITYELLTPGFHEKINVYSHQFFDELEQVYLLFFKNDLIGEKIRKNSDFFCEDIW